MTERMVSIARCESNWSDRYGICMLTGEADALGMRVLCDVNDEGRELLKVIFGMPDLSLGAPMNTHVNGQRATGSVFIPYDLLETIKVVALMRQPGVVEVWKLGGGSFRGMTEADCESEMFRRYEEGMDYRGLTEAEFQEWYKLQDKWRCHQEINDNDLRRHHYLEMKRGSFFGIIQRWQKAPRNRRGPAGSADGLTHAKMM